MTTLLLQTLSKRVLVCSNNLFVSTSSKSFIKKKLTTPCRHLSCSIFPHSTPNQLYLYINEEESIQESSIPTRIYHPLMNQKFPPPSSKDIENNIDTPEKVFDIVEQHYNRENFVGGMGESDSGVWFVSSKDGNEPLKHWEFIKESIELVKEHRHGISFGVYTSGISHLIPPIPLGKSGINLSFCQVTLGGGYDPISYQQLFLQQNDENVAVDAKKCFLSVCNFIVNANEEDEPSCVISCASNGDTRVNELALNLGAVKCDVYDVAK